MNHVLVVGGTGMMANVSLWLLEKGYHVSIIARNAERMERFTERTHAKHRITPLLLDYKDSDELQTKVAATIKENGNINVVVAWIHSNAENALQVILDEVLVRNNACELFHVLGSSTDLLQIQKEVPEVMNVNYYQIRLGYIDQGTYSRWLTNDEISEGVIEAIQKKNKVTIVGQLEPWKNRP